MSLVSYYIVYKTLSLHLTTTTKLQNSVLFRMVVSKLEGTEAIYSYHTTTQ